jgi:hypothetical protein
MAALLGFHAHAQGVPVIDAAHILETVWNGFQIYQGVQNAIQTLRYTYESVQNQIRMLQRFDYTNIDSFVDTVRFADRQINFARITENRLKNIRVRIDGKNYHLDEAFLIPGAVTAKVAEDMTADMDLNARARAWSHYGLRPVNYKYAHTWQARITDVAKNLTSFSDGHDAETENSARAVQEILEKTRETESSTALSQAGIEVQALSYEQLVRLNYNLSQIGELFASKSMSEIKIPQRLVVSSDFLEESNE